MVDKIFNNIKNKIKSFYKVLIDLCAYDHILLSQFN